jgi:DNA-binding transcriptional regulator of glucitol operon
VRRFFTLGWLGLHALAIVLVTVFLGFGWWQLQRAEAGNMRSWGYTFEWPMFAIFVIVMWVKMMYDEVHEDGKEAEEAARTAAAPRPAPAGAAVPGGNGQVGGSGQGHDAETDPELAAYNRYLARLNDEARRRR